MKPLSHLLLALILAFSFSENAKAQTNPVPQSLPYSENFDDLVHSSTTWPAGIQGWRINNVGPGADFTLLPAGDDRGLEANGDANQTGNMVYNFNQKIGFRSTTGGNNFIVLALNTTGFENITFEYDIMTIRNIEDGIRNEIGLQYRLGTSGNFINIPVTLYANPTTPTQDGVGATTGLNTQTISVVLPEALNNQPIVQLRWVKRDMEGTSGGNNTRPSFAIDNISATGDEITFSNFYYSGSGNLADVSNWGSNTNGTGSNPSGFDLNDVVFVVTNINAVHGTVTLDEPWAITGENSRVVVGNGTTASALRLNAPLTGTVDVENLGILHLAHATYPTLGTLAQGSTVIFSDDATTIPYRSYSNLTLSNINPQFSGNGTITLTGNLNLTGTVTMPAARGANEYNFSFSGSAAQTLSGNGNVIRSYEMNFNKSEGSVSLNAANGGTTISTDNQLTFNIGSDASFADNGQTIYAGNSVNIAGDGDSYDFTGTLILAGTEEGIVNGAGTGNNFNVREDGNNGLIVAALNNLIVKAANSGGEFRFRDGSTDQFVIKGDFTVEESAAGRILFYDNELFVGGNISIPSNENITFSPTLERLVLNGSSAQTVSASLLPAKVIEIDNAAGVTINDFTVAPTERLHVANGTLNANNNLTIGQGVYVTGTSNGSITGNLTAQQTVTGSGDTWKMLGSPLEAPFTGEDNSGLFSSVWTQVQQGGNGANIFGQPNIYQFFEDSDSDNLSHYWRPVTHLNETLLPGTGLLVYLFGKDALEDEEATWPKTLEVTGTVHADYFDASGISLPVSFTSREVDENEIGGWNLLSNPYLTSLDWHSVVSENSQLQTTVYVYNADLGQYATYNAALGQATNDGSRYIAPFQSFFVRTLEADPADVVLPRNDNADAATLLSQNEMLGSLRIQLETNGISDEFVLQLSQNEVPRNSYQLLPPTQRIANLYTVGADAYTVYQTTKEAEISLPLFMIMSEEGNVRLNWQIDQKMLDSYSVIQLRDLASGFVIDLLGQESYETFSASNFHGGAFSAPKNSEYQRFVLELQQTPTSSEVAALPTELRLSQNYPNPFNPSTIISYHLPAQDLVTLRVYDMLGRQVAMLVNEMQAAGSHQVTFDASYLTSGVYLYKLTAGSETKTGRMTLIK